MKIFAIALAMILAAIPSNAFASWQSTSTQMSLNGCQNYTPIDGRNYACNTGSGGLGAFHFNGSTALSVSQMRGQGVKNWEGENLSWVRTIGLSGTRALLHMNANGYGDGYAIPVYAELVSGKWKLRGAIKVNGKIQRIYSSSMAYLYRGGKHYMVQDAGAYGYGKLVAFESSDGINYRKIGGDITSVIGDSGANWQDVEFHNGRFHLVYTPNGWQNTAIRHLSAASMSGPWRVENRTAGYGRKGANLTVIDGNLYAYSYNDGAKRWYRVSTGGDTVTNPPTSSGQICTGGKVAISGRNITVTWTGGGKCIVKLVGPTNKWITGASSGVGISGLKPGSYKLLVREGSQVRSTVRFKKCASC